MTEQQTIESVKRNIGNLEQLCLSAPTTATAGISEAIKALDKLLLQLMQSKT